MNIKNVVCTDQLEGFTIGSIYPVNMFDNRDGIKVNLKITDDNGEIRKFNSVEGDGDFKNWFKKTS